ncbi:hypothetical protein TNCV_3455531 [Trichonephila clavipes]|nr:hypothetical protein TNCV_3455531 [Trichonephila clavipes]
MNHDYPFTNMSGWPSGLRRQTQGFLTLMQGYERSGPRMWAWVSRGLLQTEKHGKRSIRQKSLGTSGTNRFDRRRLLTDNRTRVPVAGRSTLYTMKHGAVTMGSLVTLRGRITGDLRIFSPHASEYLSGRTSFVPTPLFSRAALFK